MSSFTASLSVTQIGARRWRVNRSFDYYIGSLEAGFKITVPRDYETDFYSIPRPARWLFDPAGLDNQPAVLHDYLYTHWHHLISRRFADYVFAEAMEVKKIPLWKRVLMYWAVRIGGPRHYWKT